MMCTQTLRAVGIHISQHPLGLIVGCNKQQLLLHYTVWVVIFEGLKLCYNLEFSWVLIFVGTVFCVFVL